MPSVGKAQFMNRLSTFNARHANGPRVVYASMEYGIKQSMPIYGGGLGILSGDTVKSAADLGIPMVAVGLRYNEGNFKQTFEGDWQQNSAQEWDPNSTEDLYDLETTIEVPYNGGLVKAKLWGFEVTGLSGEMVPLVLLDTAIPENDQDAYNITRGLYLGGWQKIAQRVMLGVGGFIALKELGVIDPSRDIFHSNEGHGAFMYAMAAAEQGITPEDIQNIWGRNVFTTHTPVPAAFDRFHVDHVRETFANLPEVRDYVLSMGTEGSHVNMALLGMNSSSLINGVSQLHGDVTKEMFPDLADRVMGITNGVHHLTWTSEPMKRLFDRYVPGWREDPEKLAEIIKFRFEPNFQEALLRAHVESKKLLLDYIRKVSGKRFREDALTVGFARRFAEYKRGNLVFSDIEWLKSIARKYGSLQLVFAGKSHPDDDHGKSLLQQLRQTIEAIENDSRSNIRAIFLEDYGIPIGALMTAGADVWLNTPRRPMEASGTSGMKAALNGVPSISTRDGWCAEAQMAITGWAFGLRESYMLGKSVNFDVADASELYWTLDKVGQTYYRMQQLSRENRFGSYDPFLDRMLHSIALNGSFFNTHRMVREYGNRLWQI